MTIVGLQRKLDTLTEEFEASALAKISSTIDSIFRDEALPFGHEEIYRVEFDDVFMRIICS